MNIKEVYDKYQTPQNLQEHMLRVGATATILTDNWIGKKIDKPAIIIAALLHDIAKPITFDIAKQAQFGMSPTDIANLIQLQKMVKKRFGTDEHIATMVIINELGCNATTIEIIDTFEWIFIPQHLNDNNIEPLIAIYCDLRIGWHRILSLSERFAELQIRSVEEDIKNRAKDGKTLEKLIQSNVLIDLHNLTNNMINKKFEQLLDIEL